MEMFLLLIPVLLLLLMGSMSMELESLLFSVCAQIFVVACLVSMLGSSKTAAVNQVPSICVITNIQCCHSLTECGQHQISIIKYIHDPTYWT